MFKNHFYGSLLANSSIRPANSYGWDFQFEKNSFQNLIISYTGVPHLGARIRNRILKNIINKEDYSKKELFEAGCGMGLISLHLAKYFKSTFGVDIQENKIKQAKILMKDNNLKSSSFKKADILENNFTKKKFDVIICFEVIEHVKSDRKLIETLSKRLKSDGKIILSFPSKSLLSAIAQKSLQHEKIGFLPDDIRKLARQEKLKVSEEYSFGNTIFAKLIIAFDFFLRKIFPAMSALFFPLFYPFMVIDLYLPKMGTPRGYVLVLERS